MILVFTFISVLAIIVAAVALTYGDSTRNKLGSIPVVPKYTDRPEVVGEEAVTKFSTLQLLCGNRKVHLTASFVFFIASLDSATSNVIEGGSIPTTVGYLFFAGLFGLYAYGNFTILHLERVKESLLKDRYSEEKLADDRFP
jgi:hypothetical protein